MTVAELIAELEQQDPETMVVIDRENHGWWSLDYPNGLQDTWIVRDGLEYRSTDETTEGAAKAVRIW